MTSIQRFQKTAIKKDNSEFSRLKVTLETAFYGNNVHEVASLKEAYALAKEAPNTIILAQEVAHAEALGLESSSKVLLENSGAIVGRTAKARRLFGEDAAEDTVLIPLVREAVYQAGFSPFLSAKAVVGLDEEFMIEAHIMMPKEESNNLYSWLLNFQMLNQDYKERFKHSKSYQENDIYIFFDPCWSHPDYPDGLAYFDAAHNVAAILGMRYFGEIKKGTLTLAWAAAARNGYAACHGGLKSFKKENPFVASFFGLSGSGKSTLTHAKHDGKYDIKVLHDDAFIISMSTGSSIALEPAYFDKTSDYPAGHPEQDYFVTVQNCGVTLDEEGRRVLVTEDIRNGNGRTIKSRYATPNRVDKIDDPITAIFWIMKDDSLPPIMKINHPLLATIFGCTLMTKRSNAENVKGNMGELVIEPYANPFRVYPLIEDFHKFFKLFDTGVDCYIINTGKYIAKDISKEVTLACIEKIVDNEARFEEFPLLESCQYLPFKGFRVPEDDPDYRILFKERLDFRLSYLLDFNNRSTQEEAIPKTVISYLKSLVSSI